MTSDPPPSRPRSRAVTVRPTRSPPPVPSPRPAFIAIAGGSGSGKSWLARRLARRLQPLARVLALDHFYRDLSLMPPAHRNRVNFDHPDALDWPLLHSTLDRLMEGRDTRVPSYDFATHTRRKRSRRWSFRPVVLVEGLWPWGPTLSPDRYLLRIFCDTPDALRQKRRRLRDVTERGRSLEHADRQWRRHTLPMHRLHVAPLAAAAQVRLTPGYGPAVLDALVRQIQTLTVPPHQPVP